MHSALKWTFMPHTDEGPYFNRVSATTSATWYVLDTWTVCASLRAPVILVHVCAAEQSAKGHVNIDQRVCCHITGLIALT